jgi:hypothetical protein
MRCTCQPSCLTFVLTHTVDGTCRAGAHTLKQHPRVGDAYIFQSLCTTVVYHQASLRWFVSSVCGYQVQLLGSGIGKSSNVFGSRFRGVVDPCERE